MEMYVGTFKNTGFAECGLRLYYYNVYYQNECVDGSIIKMCVDGSMINMCVFMGPTAMAGRLTDFDVCDGFNGGGCLKRQTA